MMMKSGVTWKSSVFPMTEFSGKFEAGRKEESLLTNFELTYGDETMSFIGRADLTPVFMNGDFVWNASQFPMTQFTGNFEVGRKEESILTIFGLTYGLEKNTISLNGRTDITPMFLKSEVAWMSSEFPMTEFNGKIEAGRREETFLAAFDLTYGLEKNTMSFDGHMDMSPMMMKSGVTWKSSVFPMTEFSGKFEAGRTEESVMAVFDLTYGMEKNTMSFDSHMNLYPMLVKGEVAWKASELPMTEFSGKFEAGRKEESLLTNFELTY